MSITLTLFGSAGPFTGWNRTVRDVRGIAVRCFRRRRRRLERSERYNLSGIIRCIFLTTQRRLTHSFTVIHWSRPSLRRVSEWCLNHGSGAFGVSAFGGATTHEAGRPRSPPNVPIDSVIRVMQINCASTSPRWRDIPGAGSAAALASIRRCRARYRRSSQSFQVQYLSKM